MNSGSTESASCTSRHDGGGRALIQPLCIGLFFLLLSLMIHLLNGQAYFLKINAFIGEMQAREHGIVEAVLIYLAAGAIFISMGGPRLWVSAGAGAVFDPWLGTAVALGASLLGASVLFLVGWWFLSPGKWPFLERRLGRYRHAFQKKAFLWVLYARLFPFSNSTVVSLFSGYCKVGFIPYLAGSFIGFIPLTVIMCLFGSGSTSGRMFHFVLGFGFITLLYILTLIFKKWFPTAALIFHKEE